MQNLPNILPLVTPLLTQKESTAASPQPNGTVADPFDHLMARAISNAAATKKPVAAGHFEPGKAAAQLVQTLNAGRQFVPLPTAAIIEAAPPAAVIMPTPTDQTATTPAQIPNLQAKANAATNTAPSVPLVPHQNPGTGIVSIPQESNGPGDTPTKPKEQKPTKAGADASQATVPITIPAIISGQSLPPEINNIIFQTEVFSPAPVYANGNTVSVAPTSSAAISPLPILPESAVKISGPPSDLISNIHRNQPATPASAPSQPAAETQNKISEIIGEQSAPKKLPTDGPTIQSSPATGQKTTAMAKELSTMVEAATAPERPTREVLQNAPVSTPVATSVEVPVATPSTTSHATPLATPPTAPAQKSNVGVLEPSIADGTPSALMVELMHSGGKSDKTAGPAGKLLPGEASVVAHKNDLPIGAIQTTSTTVTNTNSSNTLSATTTTALDKVESFSSGDFHLQALERTHDLVAVHAMRLENEDSHALTVVLKPGAGTQLSLELRQNGDGIQAQAALQHGDYQHLNQNWSDLQQRLEQRGIRLAPLVDQGSFGNSQNENSKHQPNQPAEVMARPGFGSNRTLTKPSPAGRAKAASGWETWA